MPTSAEERKVYEALLAQAKDAMVGHDRALGYHNWSHITYALNAHNQLFMGRAVDPAVQMTERVTLMYHDVIYIPGEKNNEAQSAKYLSWQLRTLMPEAEIQYTAAIYKKPEKLADVIGHAPELIMLTTVPHHLAEFEDEDGGEWNSLHVVLDCDLSALASAYPEFVARQSAIASEHIPNFEGLSPDKQWEGLKKSADFLENFLNKERIYRTEEAYAVLEKPARANIQRFISEINEGVRT